MATKKLGDQFFAALSTTTFSSRTSGLLKRFVYDLNMVTTREDLDKLIRSSGLLKGLMKKEGIQNKEFDYIIGGLTKKL